MQRLATAMILAAGYGTRMQDLSRDVPKPLLPMNHLRLIEIALHKLANQGFQRVVINVHYIARSIMEFLGDGSRYGVEILYSQETHLLDTGGGIAHAEHYFRGETILTLNADVISDIDFQALYHHHVQHRAVATMAVFPSRNNRDYRLVIYDDWNRLKGFLPRSRPLPESDLTGIFMGYAILSPAARAYLTPRPQSVIDAFYLPALQNKEPLFVYPFRGQWYDVGDKSSYLNIRQKIQEGQISLETMMR
ncbi:MAG: nucleotidyltransferase family protein [Calditrichaeota bacterium]|nr:nucleotidyltransferase family protein [Calditrichota bacterium]